MTHRFKDLEIWKQSRLLCTEIYLISTAFPENEKFGLTNQLRSASVSIPSNITEGSSRSSNKEFNRFLDFSLGSAYEVETQLLISSDLKFITTDQVQQILPKLNNIIKMILSFKKAIK
jgi:four helix bundle protein